jgi:hypothetical protein
MEESMRPRVLGSPFVVPFLCLLFAGAYARAQSGSATHEPDVIEIDGAKNPELIPQWSAWGYAFRIFSGGPRELPTSVLTHVTRAEATLIMKEADGVQKVDATCQARHLKMMTERGAKKIEDLAQEVRALNLDCRWETLHARDRVLAGLSPEGQVALTAFVESTKTGTRVSVPRKDLTRFREPE